MVGAAQGLAFAFDDGEEVLAEGEVLAEVGGDFFRRNQGCAVTPSGGLLVARRSYVRFAIFAFSCQAI